MSAETFCDRCEAPGAISQAVYIGEQRAWYDLCRECLDGILVSLPDDVPPPGVRAPRPLPAPWRPRKPS